MRAVVLVGGEGTRLRPLTFTTPKQLLPVVEVPMIERVLSNLARHGIDQAVLSLGYRPDAFYEAYPSGLVTGVRIAYAVEPEPLDTAGAVAFAADHADIDDTFVVLNGDVLSDVDLSSLVRFHRKHGASATIQLTPVSDPSRFGVVPTDSDGRVTQFIEKPPPGEAPTNLINAGTYVLEPEVLASIPLGRRTSIERETFPQLAARGRLYAQASDAYWLDTGTPEAYLQAHYDLLDGKRSGPPADEAHEVAPGVWVIGTADLEGDVLPASLLGNGAIVAPGARVEHSVVGARCTVGQSAVVYRSVLLPGARVGAGAKVAGSILGHDTEIGEDSEVEPLSVIGDSEIVVPGTKLAGARVPERGAS